MDRPSCAGLQFAAGIADQSFPRTQPITPLFLPEVTGGVAQVTYPLTPVLPKKLDFAAPASRTVSGAPTGAAAVRVRFAFAATNAAGSADSLQSSIEAYSPVGAQQKTLPESFALRDNHPNPFGELTRLEMDIPWPARVTVEVLDMARRRVLVILLPGEPSGRARRIRPGIQRAVKRRAGQCRSSHANAHFHHAFDGA